MSQKKVWYLLLSAVICLQMFCYAARLPLIEATPYDGMLSKLILYGGSILFVLVLGTMYYLKKKHPISNRALMKDKVFFSLFVIMLLLAGGLAVP